MTVGETLASLTPPEVLAILMPAVAFGFALIMVRIMRHTRLKPDFGKELKPASKTRTKGRELF
jgi:hypothetical protein